MKRFEVVVSQSNCDNVPFLDRKKLA
jgi:hypothetical protein